MDDEEFIWKVGIDVDNTELKSLRDELNKIKTNSENLSIKLGINKTNSIQENELSDKYKFQFGQINNQKTLKDISKNKENKKINKEKEDELFREEWPERRFPIENEMGEFNKKNIPIENIIHGSKKETGMNDYSREIFDILKKSEKTFEDMLELMKKEDIKKNRERDDQKKKAKSPVPFVNDLSNANVGTLAGGAVGGLVGTLAAGQTLAGAQIGATIGGFIEKIFSGVKDKVKTVSELLDNRISEDIHFRQLSYQSGMSINALYKLQQQATLTGTSLETLVESNQRLADNMLSGMDEKQTQLLMALNINPRMGLLQSGGDFAKLNDKIFKQASKALEGSNPYVRTHFLSMLGYTPEVQSARRFLNTKGVEERAQKNLEVATGGGKTPFVTGNELQDQINEVMGTKLQIQSTVRSALTTKGVAEKTSAEFLKMEANTVHLIADAVNVIGNISELKGKTFTEKAEQNIPLSYSGGGQGLGDLKQIKQMFENLFNLFKNNKNDLPSLDNSHGKDVGRGGNYVSESGAAKAAGAQ